VFGPRGCPQLSLILRSATRNDDSNIRELFALSFPATPKTSPEITRWQYWDNPFSEVRSWVWDDSGDIVAHYAGMPVPILLEGQDAVGAVGIDAATAPSHRGRGLFERLASAVYEDCGAHGIPVTMCFPNENSVRGFQKAGGLMVGELATFVYPIDAAWVAQRFRIPLPVVRPAMRLAFRVASANRADECGEVPADIGDLWRSVRARTAWGIRRDEHWWRWRYTLKPQAQYRFFEHRDHGQLRGAAATVTSDKFGGRFVLLLELMATDAEAGRALIATIASNSRDAAGIVTVALPGSPVAIAATGSGMRRLPARLGPKPVFFGVTDNMGGRETMSSSPWTLAWGDLDHI